MADEFPSNSHTRREVKVERRRTESPVEKKQVTQVTQGKVTLRKKPLWKKFVDAFRPEDNVGFLEHTLLEVIAPGVKDVFADSVHGAVDNALGGGSRTRSSRSRSGGGYTSYNRMSSTSRRRDPRDDDRRGAPPRRETRIADDAREITLHTRAEAEVVLDSLIEIVSMYDVATMRDLLSLIGESSNPVHEDWGWHDMRGSRIHRVQDGYLLDLPRPVPLD